MTFRVISKPRWLIAIASLVGCTALSAFAGVTVTSPTSGATSASPIHVTASATPASSSYPITSMRIYLDNTSVYSISSNKLDTYVSASAGSHNLVVQAWDSNGSIYKTARSVTVSPSNSTSVAVAVSPSTAVLQLGNTQQFSASVSGTTTTGVTWWVNGVQGGNSSVGTISTSGLYKAPGSLPSSPSVTMTAKSVADPTKSASAAVSLAATTTAVTVNVSPTSASVPAGQTKQFTSTVSGTTNTTVQWAVNGISGGNYSVGYISSTGLYTAPSCPTSSSATVSARSTYDTSASASARVSVGAASTSSLNRYVATNGSDSADGSACHPWATIQHAADASTAGMTIRVMPGTYKVSTRVISSHSGTSSAYIRFVGSYDKATRTWNTKIVSSDTQVWSNGGKYVEVRGFDMTSSNLSAATGIKGQGAYSSYVDNYVHDIYADTPGAGIMIGGGADHQSVVGNVIARIAHTPGGSTDNQGIYVQENYTTIANNLVYGCAKIGIQIWSGVTSGKPQYNTVSNNTVFACYRGFTIGAANSSYADHNTVTGNIFYGNTDLGMYTGTGIQTKVGPNNYISNNNTYGSGTANFYNLTHVNDITGNPLFRNYKSDGSGDYRLQSGSPNRGKATSTGAISFDFLNYPRPYSGSYDAGAYQYVP